MLRDEVSIARRLAVAVVAAILGTGCGGSSGPGSDRQTHRPATGEQFRFTSADGWYTTATGLHPAPPQEPAATASTIPVEEPVGEFPLDTLKRLPATGIIIVVGAGPRPPWGHFPPGSLQSPSDELVSRAQEELNRLELPFNVEANAVTAHGPPAHAMPHVQWRHSLSLGRADRGTLVRGVRFPAQGATFFTWDPILHRAPDRPWRRYGNDRLVRIVLRVLAGYARAHPDAPRVGIGDFSRPHGGDFRPKHVSHQNGLDVDVYYPRLDRRERPPLRAPQIDRRPAQDLLDRFLAEGAAKIFVGPNTHLTGPPRIVRILANHDNHMHVRIAAP